VLIVTEPRSPPWYARAPTPGGLRMETNVRTRTFEPAGGQAPDRKDDCADGGRSLVGRIAAIMDSFDQQDPVLSLVELSRRSGLPKSTAHRLAEQLRAMGWLERCHSGYRVGMRLFELGGLAAKQAQLRDPA